MFVTCGGQTETRYKRKIFAAGTCGLKIEFSCSADAILPNCFELRFIA